MVKLDCHIRVKGYLNPDWAEWLGLTSLSHHDDGTTELVGMVPDQAALHGLLCRVRDMGLPLLSLSVDEVPAQSA